MPVGRPSSYSEAIADEICQRLMCGESMVQICDDDKMPDRKTVLNWQRDNAEFSTRCARARLMQADLMDDKIIEIAKKVERGELEARAGSVVLSAYQWRASKLAPKKYGDRLENVVTGADGGPLQSEITVNFVKPNGSSENQR